MTKTLLHPRAKLPISTRHHPRTLPSPEMIPISIASLAVLTLLIVPWPLNLLAVAGGAAFVMAWFNPPVALALAVVSVPVQSVGEYSAGAFTFRYTFTVVWAIILAWTARRLIAREPVRLGFISLALLAHVVVVGLSGVVAADTGLWAAELYRWSIALVVFIIAVDVSARSDVVRPLVVGMSLATTGASVYGIYQVVEGTGPRAFNVDGLLRAYSTFGQPNPFAGYLGISVPLLFALSASWWKDRAASPHLFGGVIASITGGGALLGMVALTLTQSRGGWVGVTLGLGVVAWLVGGRVRWGSIIIVGLIAVIASATPVGPRVAERWDAVDLSLSNEVQVTAINFATRERIAHWRAGVAMVKDEPWLGVGAGNFSRHYRNETVEWRFRVPRGHAHNAFIQVAALTGIIGLLTYAMFIGAVAWRLVRALLTSDGAGRRGVVVGAIGVTVAFNVHNLFDYLHVLNFSVQLGVVWAMAVSSQQWIGSDERSGAESER